jgi:hypothetical protein
LDDLTTKIGIPGGAGLLGIILGFFGLRSRVRHVEKDNALLMRDARFGVTCDKIHTAVDTRLEGIEALGKESRDDIKELLRRSK